MEMLPFYNRATRCIQLSHQEQRCSFAKLWIGVNILVMGIYMFYGYVMVDESQKRFDGTMPILKITYGVYPTIPMSQTRNYPAL